MRIQLRNRLVKSPTGHHVDDFDPYLDTFLCPSASTPLGAVVVLPGGGYRFRAPYEGDPAAQVFNKLGFHAFTLQYRVAPYRFPDPLADLIRALKLIRSRAGEWRLDPEHIAVLGFSAGAHLAASGALFGTEYDKAAAEGDEADRFRGTPDAQILCYPVLSGASPFSHRGSMVSLLGENPDDAMLRKMDLYKQVTEDTPPAFLWHTADDATVPVQNSLAFAQAMWSCGNSCELHIFPHGSHGKGLGYGTPDVSQWPLLAARFLKNQCGFPCGAPDQQ